MIKTTHAKLIIIGSGPAGYTAAVYAARAMLEPILIQGIEPGGQLTITTDVENYPGFADVIQGPWLMEQMEKQAAHVGTKIVTDLVTKLELSQRPFRLTCDSGEENPSKVTGVRLKNVKTGALTELPADGVFIAIGHAPATELVKGQVKLKPSGYVEVAPNSTATSVPGLFAAGDVADETYRQAVTAAGLGCMAALEAERFLALRASDRAAAE